MAVLRPIGKIQPEVQRPLLRAIKPVQAHEQDDGWQPDVLRLSRTNDERRQLLVPPPVPEHPDLVVALITEPVDRTFEGRGKVGKHTQRRGRSH